MQKGFAHILLIPIFLIALLSAFGIYWFKFRTPPVDKQSLVYDKLVPPLPPASTAPQEKIVKIDDLGLSLSLPAATSLKEETEEEYFKRANGQIRKNFTSYIAYPPAEFTEAFYILPGAETNLEKSDLAVWVFQNPDNLDPKAFYKKYWYYPFVWGDFTSRKEGFAPNNPEMIAGKEGGSGMIDSRPGKPKFIYLPLEDKNLMLQIQYPTEASASAVKVLESFKFE